MLMFFDEGFGGLPGFRFEFKAIDGGVIILMFIKGVAEFVEGLKGEVSKRCVTYEGGLVEINHLGIAKREAGFKMKMVIGILGAQKIKKLLFFMHNLARERFFLIGYLAFHKVIVV